MDPFCNREKMKIDGKMEMIKISQRTKYRTKFHILVEIKN